MDIWMNVVKYDTVEKCMDKGVIPFAICLSRKDKRNKMIDDFIEKHYGITIDKRGYACCICNVILADKCRDFNYKAIKMKDKTVRKIKGFEPLRSQQLEGKVIVKIIFEDGSIDSIKLVEEAILDIEQGKVLLNAE